MKQMRGPSGYLLHQIPELKDDAAFYAEIVAGQKTMADLGLGCNPARWHDERPATLGSGLSGIYRSQMYGCGYGVGEEVAFWDIGFETIAYKVSGRTDRDVQQVANMRIERNGRDDAGGIMEVAFAEPERMMHMPRLLGFTRPVSFPVR